MDKKGLIECLAKQTGLTQRDARKFLDAYTDIVMNVVANSEEVRIVGFGTFGLRFRSAREGRNPATNEKIMIPASSQAYFKPGQGFKNIIAFADDKRRAEADEESAKK